MTATTATARPVFDGLTPLWTPDDLPRACELASSPDVVEGFEEAFLRVAGLTGAAQFFPSARSALTAILRSLNRPEKFVLVPAFCCSAVAEAIHQAGRSPLLVDSGPELGSVAIEQVVDALRTRPVAAMIIPHLYGSAVDVRAILPHARTAGAAIIEDCAHTIGGSIGGNAVGSIGDWSIFSFNVDKPFCLAGGGMLVRNASASECGCPLPRRLFETKVKEECDELSRFGEWLSAFRRESLNERDLSHVGLRRLAPGLVEKVRLWRAILRPHGKDLFPARAVGRVRAALGRMRIGALPSVIRRRTENFARLASSFQAGASCQLVRSPADVVPAWSRAKVFFPQGERYDVDAIGRHLRRAGYRAGQFHWGYTLDRDPCGYRSERMGNLQNARRLAALSLDLPLDENMQRSDVEGMVELLFNLTGQIPH